MEFTRIELSGRVVVVTGASSGIGAATARLLHRAGALPVLAARRQDRLDELADELGGALAVRTDVTDAAQAARLVARTVDRHGRIDGLVNNAGAALHRPLLDLDLDEFAGCLDLNVVAALRMIQLSAAPMRAAGFGRIVNISSGTTKMVPVGISGYAASKAALNMLSAVARAELADSGIAVSTLLPSITATEFNDASYQAGVEVRPGLVGHTAEYVAGFVLSLLRSGEAEVQVPHGPEQARP